MSRDELRRTLEHLHAELGRASELDDATRVRLRSLQAEVQAALDRSLADSPLRARLEDAIVDFEASHPELARRMAQVIDTLAFYNL